MFAEFGVLNYWTYLVGAIFIVLVPGPNTLFVLKNSVGSGIKGGYLAACGVFIGDAILMFWRMRASQHSLKPHRYYLISFVIWAHFICSGWEQKFSMPPLKQKAEKQPAKMCILALFLNVH